MKNKLRKIVIDNSEFLYRIINHYLPEEKVSLVSLKVFLNEQKQTPLIIEFRTKDDLIIGSLLNIGVALNNSFSHSSEIVNINAPKYISEFIKLGVEAGWTGSNKIEPQDGVQYLAKLGYVINELLPS